MTSFEIGHLAYLAILGAMVVIWYLASHRLSLGRTLRHAAGWVLIFLVVVAAAGVWDDIRTGARPAQSVFADQGRIEVPRARDGHYYLTLTVNGTPVDFVVDTGATDIVLSHDDAERIGLPLDRLAYVGRAMTANGEVRTAPVRLQEMALGPVADRNVPAWVNEGDMQTSLLGMTYLQRWERIEISGGALTLER